MASFTPADLDNGALDLQTIGSFANSADPTLTTRLADVVPTRAGLTADFQQQISDAGGTLAGLVSTATAASTNAQAQAAAIAATVIGGRRTDTWAALSALTGVAVGAPGEVTNDAAGTHTDPVTATVVPNEGLYTYTATGWKWAGTRDISAVKTAAAALADEVVPTVPDGNHYISVAPQTKETLLAVNSETGKAWGAAVDLLGIRPRVSFWRDYGRRLAATPVVFRNGEGWNHTILWGQSNALGSADAAPPLTPVAAYYNLTFNGGVRADGSVSAPWDATQPLGERVDGNNGETSCSGAAESANVWAVRNLGATPDKYVQFYSVAAQGATAIAGLVKGSAVYTRLMSQITQAKALATAASQQYNFNILVTQQGETDNVNGTTRTAYLAAALQLVSDLNADAKAIKTPQDDVHTLWEQCSYYATNPSATNCALAQLDLTHASTLAHISHASYCSPHDEDDTHRSSAGHKLDGEYAGRAQEQLRAGRRPDNLEPLAAYVVNGTELHIVYDPPTYPLTLDINGVGGLLQKATDYGIKVVDDTGTLVLSAIGINAAGNEVVCTLDRALGTNPKCRVGLDYLPWTLSVTGKGITNGATTNIRDSTDADKVVIDGTTYTLYHWSLHNELAIAVLSGVVP